MEHIGKAGVGLFVVLYGGREEDLEMVSSNITSLDPQKLISTESVVYFHSLWVYLQVMLWFKGGPL